jgi:hypothetical protein
VHDDQQTLAKILLIHLLSRDCFFGLAKPKKPCLSFDDIDPPLIAVGKVNGIAYNKSPFNGLWNDFFSSS